MEKQAPWEEISPMPEAKKNASACVASRELIYLFGGGNERQSSTNLIEQYKITTDSWTTINLRIPQKISFSVCYKTTTTSLLILGGTTQYVGGERMEKVKSVYEFKFGGKKEIMRVKDLDESTISICDPFSFEDQPNALFLINEDKDSADPPVVKYSYGQGLTNLS